MPDTFTVNEVDALRMLRTSIRGTAKIAHFAGQEDVFTVLTGMYVELDARVQLAKAKLAEADEQVSELEALFNASPDKDEDPE